MKGFLFDENLPQKTTFAPTLPVIHARSFGESVSDSRLWQMARANQLVIVSKDADFSHRIMLASPPPWVVHLRFGNLRGRDFQLLLAQLWPRIEELLPTHKLVNVYTDRLEAVSA